MTAFDILTRLKAATGPDRVIDLYIMAFENNATVEEGGMGFILRDKSKNGNWLDVGQPSWPRSGIPETTASINAALALVERMLPGSLWSIGHVGDLKPGVYRSVIMPFRGISSDAEGPTPAIAILTALFEAVAAKEVKGANGVTNDTLASPQKQI